MSQAYAREEQNNDLLNSLSQKTSALKSVTLNIYDQASSSHSTLDNTSETFSNLRTSLRGSGGRLARAARSGDRIAVLKVAGIVVVVGLLVWWVLGWLFF